MGELKKPLISKVLKGIEGKSIFVYGTNRTGKTYNCVQAKKPLVMAFERGLDAIDGIPYVPMMKWKDWTDWVKDLTGINMPAYKEEYSTIIIDTADIMGDMASEYICQTYGADSIGSGKNGYGLWSEYGAELKKWIRLIVNAGYTIIFIGHEGQKTELDERGAKYDKVYPSGDRRLIEPILNACDFICYAKMPPVDAEGKLQMSTLYMQGTRTVHAGGRFKYVPPTIPEWTFAKLEQAIIDAVTQEEKEKGIKGASYAEIANMEAKTQTDLWAGKSIEEIIEIVSAKASKMINATGSPEDYLELLFNEFGTRDFKVSGATMQQKPQLEQLYEALSKAGY